MYLIERSNDALRINPPTGATSFLTLGGSDWLWAVTALYCFCLVVVVGLTPFARGGEKIFHYLFTISLFVGSIAYFTIASDLGFTPIRTELNGAGTRQIFYAMYINWFVGWTPMITALGLISGVSWATIIFNISISWIWVVSYLCSALVSSSYKWGFFGFGTGAYLLLAYSLLTSGLTTARRIGITSHFSLTAGWLVFVWMLYPIAFGVADGGNKIGVAEGYIFWGILDVMTVPVLSAVILGLASRWDYREMNLYFTQYGRVAAPHGNYPEGGEKTAGAPAPAAAATDAPVVSPEHTV